MLPKVFLLLVLVFAVFGLIEAKNRFKTLQSLQNKQLSSSILSQHGDRALEDLLRRQRDVEDTSSEEENSPLVRFFVSVLANFVEQMAKSDRNLTFIGWQRIMNDEGGVKEIHTIQLVIPPKPKSDDIDIGDEDDDEEEDDSSLRSRQIQEMKEMFGPMAQLGGFASVGIEEFDREGEETTVIYMDKDELYIKSGDLAVYNRTAVATPEEVAAFIQNLNFSGFGFSSVLEFDTDGKIDLNQSSILPHMLARVEDQHEASEELLTSAPGIVSVISQQYPKEEIPKQLALHYNEAFPDYKWRVLVNSENDYLTKDVALTVSLDNFDLEGDRYDTYLIYGTKLIK